MNKQRVFTLVAANLVILMLITVFWPQRMVEPGPVIPAHQAFETDCFACHQPFIGSRPALCMKCHKPAEIGLVTTTGLAIAHERKLTPFHQDLLEPDCIACHSDHKGVKAFRPIGRFSHDLLKVARRDQCSGCHQAPLDAMHQGEIGACGQCHFQRAWTPATFEHESLFSLTGDHAASCNTCHVGKDYRTYTCYGCHEHSRSKIREKHLEEGISDYENCIECHRNGEADAGEHDKESEGHDD
ncbi:class III cytochrome C family protein [Thiocapsa bogorovii]|uniref:class III cytochrome C family protein n=1 Tax=Thiocapsa bogorovii TaxID=521689 RepID=UPI001E2DA280|nr:class III cytochrome C family protein [Thiocapsa bogorovii]UHD16493.1 class III cytochrome C family protein [Thiocapsa bogorovii]